MARRMPTLRVWNRIRMQIRTTPTWRMMRSTTHWSTIMARLRSANIFVKHTFRPNVVCTNSLDVQHAADASTIDADPPHEEFLIS
eukprot:12500883-Prorocentrum_lima.AAC.1